LQKSRREKRIFLLLSLENSKFFELGRMKHYSPNFKKRKKTQDKLSKKSSLLQNLKHLIDLRNASMDGCHTLKKRLKGKYIKNSS
jgi:hypothetical protein